ncbi:MAG: phosphate propanoyltransferase [Bacteroidota bacterium]
MMNEALIEIITEEVLKTLHHNGDGNQESITDNCIPLGVSNRHIHLTEETFKKLFGQEAEIEKMSALYQPKEYASKQTLTIVGTKQRAIHGVRILGPLRNYDQVEISLTDARVLGIDAPVADSGDLSNAAPLTLVGPAGSVYLDKCAIVASRHIHMSSTDAARFSVEAGDYCRVRISGEKTTVFEDVLVRVNDGWYLQIHLDTDDGNAANVRSDTKVEFLGKMEYDEVRSCSR